MFMFMFNFAFSQVRTMRTIVDKKLGSWCGNTQTSDQVPSSDSKSRTRFMRIELWHKLRVTQRFTPDLACVAVVGVQVAVMCEGREDHRKHKKQKARSGCIGFLHQQADGSQLLGALARSPDLPIRSQSSAITLSHAIGTHHLATWLNSYQPIRCITSHQDNRKLAIWARQSSCSLFL